MILRHRTFRRQGRHHRQRKRLGDPDEILGRARPECAASYVNQRPLRLVHQLKQFVDVIRIGTEAHAARLRVRRDVGLRHTDVLRDLDDHRPRAT